MDKSKEKNRRMPALFCLIFLLAGFTVATIPDFEKTKKPDKVRSIQKQLFNEKFVYYSKIAEPANQLWATYDLNEIKQTESCNVCHSKTGSNDNSLIVPLKK